MQLSLSLAAGYAVHATHYLASADNSEPVMVRHIAEKYDIPYDSTLKALRLLAKAGIVRAHRGCQGGFQLAKESGDISLLDIVVAIDGPLISTDPLPKNSGDMALKAETDKLLNDAVFELRRRLSKTKISDLEY